MKKKGLKLLAGMAFATVLVSCSPQLFYLPVDMKHASKSGLNLNRKAMSVVYLDDGYQADSCLNHGLAEGFAIALEKEYFGGDRAISLYQIAEQQGQDYAQKDTMINLVMDLGTDVVFLMDTPVFKNISISDAVPSAVQAADSVLKATAYMGVEQNIYVYDSMNRQDTVIRRKVAQNIVQPLYLPADYDDSTLLKRLAVSLEPEGIRAGGEMAKDFMPTWKTEEYGIIYYDEDAWIDAATAAVDFRWKDAMTKWMALLDTKNMEKRACAEYNLALACYMSGDYVLALEWLDRSDADCPISISRNLRARIKARM